VDVFLPYLFVFQFTIYIFKNCARNLHFGSTYNKVPVFIPLCILKIFTEGVVDISFIDGFIQHSVPFFMAVDNIF